MVLKSIFGKKEPTNKTLTSDNSLAIPEQSSSGSANAVSSPSQPNEPPAAIFLEQAMVDNARNDSPETRTKVYQELLFSDLLLTMADSNENGESLQNTETSHDQSAPPLNVAILSNSQGTPFCAAFTSISAAKRWRAEGGNYAGIRGQDLFKLLESSPAEVLVVNPGNAPFIVLHKVEFRQLALGVIPQSPHSPVQVGVTSGEGVEDPSQTKIAFPPGVFNDEQRHRTLDVLKANENIEAAAIGAILPPGANEQTGWMRTIFLRVQGIEESAEEMQKFCLDIKTTVSQNTSLFDETPFEVGVMPDPSFWQAMHENKIILFDKATSL